MAKPIWVAEVSARNATSAIVEVTATGLDGRSVVLMIPAAGAKDIIDPIRAAAESTTRELARSALSSSLRKTARDEAEVFPPRSGSFRVLMNAEQPLLYLSVCDSKGRWAEIPLDPESTRLLIGNLSTGLLQVHREETTAQ